MSDKNRESPVGIETHRSEVSRHKSAIVAPGAGANEDSGLHDLRALAQSARRRIASNLRAASEANEVFMASSPLALRVVALPGSRQALRDDTAAASRHTGSQRRGSLPAWLYTALGGVAAGAVVLFIVRGGPSNQVASRLPLASTTTPALTNQADSTVVTPAVFPDSPATSAVDAVPAAPVTGSAAPSTNQAAAAAGTPGSAGNSQARSSQVAADQIADQSSEKPAEKPAVERAASDSAAVTATAGAPAVTVRAAAEPADVTIEDKGEHNGEQPANQPADALDALLAEAAGGSTGRGQPGASSKPMRTSLDGNDVKQAMAPIQAKAPTCYATYRVPGVVTVRFSVAPSGEVISAAAQGELKGTDTGNCVADLVRTATFPQFSGAQMSFSYPFLLSQ